MMSIRAQLPRWWSDRQAHVFQSCSSHYRIFTIHVDSLPVHCTWPVWRTLYIFVPFRRRRSDSQIILRSVARYRRQISITFFA